MLRAFGVAVAVLAAGPVSAAFTPDGYVSSSDGIPILGPFASVPAGTTKTITLTYTGGTLQSGAFSIDSHYNYKTIDADGSVAENDLSEYISCVFGLSETTRCYQNQGGEFPTDLASIEFQEGQAILRVTSLPAYDNCATAPGWHCAEYRTGSAVFFDAAFSTENGVTYDLAVSDPSSPVPEPATWAMMIAGFGMAGAALRRRPMALRAA